MGSRPSLAAPTSGAMLGGERNRNAPKKHPAPPRPAPRFLSAITSFRAPSPALPYPTSSPTTKPFPGA
ncbi:hypothetical protein EYF80_004787 [Liparis tanakae]|uniref:Uncharacterized protein n=1 Tax=Liparis tanakae TaxID=230148 RepID=A0A4Z2J5H8_9TELE|nr:hypothetical protein EYF80_004787 [Liparis tanakae]